MLKLEHLIIGVKIIKKFFLQKVDTITLLKYVEENVEKCYNIEEVYLN